MEEGGALNRVTSGDPGIGVGRRKGGAVVDVEHTEGLPDRERSSGHTENDQLY